jgi:hypothetical protein
VKAYVQSLFRMQHSFGQLIINRLLFSETGVDKEIIIKAQWATGEEAGGILKFQITKLRELAILVFIKDSDQTQTEA